MQPLALASDPDLELVYLKALSGFESTSAAWDGASRQLVVEFNANVPYGGPSQVCLAKFGKLVGPALNRLVPLGMAWGRKGEGAETDEERDATIALLGAMRRLLAVQAAAAQRSSSIAPTPAPLATV